MAVAMLVNINVSMINMVMAMFVVICMDIIRAMTLSNRMNVVVEGDPELPTKMKEKIVQV